MAAGVFKNQDYFTIICTAPTIPNVTVASSLIMYINPDGKSGEFPGTFISENKTVSYTTGVGKPLSVAGYWTFWAVLITDDGRIIPSTSFKYNVKSIGSN